MTGKLPQILVVRHTETQWNAQGRLQGRRDTPLTLNGIRQAFAVAETLVPIVQQPKGNWSFWSSPLGRARQTASILADTLAVPFSQFQCPDALVERRYGEWEGLTHEDIRKARQNELDAQQTDPWNYRMPGAESKADVTARLRDWLSTLSLESRHLIVTHSGCLRMLRGIYQRATPAVIEGFREPQTAAFLLHDGSEQLIEPSAAVLASHGCESTGRSVWI